jgi:hypothetical protein
VDAAVGEAFLISGEQPVTWKDFYGGYERMLGIARTVSMSAAEAEEFFKNHAGKKTRLHRESINIIREEVAVRRRLRGTAEVQTMMKVARKIVPQSVRRSLKKRLTSQGGDADAAPRPAKAAASEPAIQPLPPALITLSASKTRVSIDKARRLLGYQPRFDFATGMQMTELWAHWANLLDGDA